MARIQPERNQPEPDAYGGGAGSNLPPLKDVVAAPGGYVRTLGRNLKQRLSERGQRGPAVFLLVLVAGVLYVKDAGAKRFVIVDGAMNDLVRPAMYDSFHRIWPVRPRVASIFLSSSACLTPPLSAAERRSGVGPR